MAVIGITGGTGFVGRHLSAQLANDGHRVIVFSRNAAKNIDNQSIEYAYWNEDKKQCDVEALRQIDAMVHLAGAGLADKRWTEERKREIMRSRVHATAFIVEQLQRHANNCKTFIAASATGIYGPDRQGNHSFEEGDEPYTDFIADVCRQWEEASLKASTFARTVILRFGIVLGKDGGAFPRFATPVSWGVKPIFGTGKQKISWIHVSDLVSLIEYALANESISGIYNAAAPDVVSQHALMQAIARAEGKKCLPVYLPAFLLKMALGEMAEELLKSCNASGQKIADAGFAFKYPAIYGAIKAIVG